MSAFEVEHGSHEFQGFRTILEVRQVPARKLSQGLELSLNATDSFN